MSRELDGALQPEQARRLAAHLEGCARCRAVREALHRTEGLFTRAGAGPGPDLTAGVLARLPRDRRAVIPPAPAWTRASSIVVIALLLVLVGASGAMLLTGAALGYGDLPQLQSSGQSLVAVTWDSLVELVSGLETAVAALWRALRWPWALIGGGIILAVGTMWAWLWARSGRWRS